MRVFDIVILASIFVAIYSFILLRLKISQDEKIELELQLKILAEKNILLIKQTTENLNKLNLIKENLITTRNELMHEHALNLKLGLYLNALYDYKAKLNLFYTDLAEIIIKYLSTRDNLSIEYVNSVKEQLEIKNFPELITISNNLFTLAHAIDGDTMMFTEKLNNIQFSEKTPRLSSFIFPHNSQYMINCELSLGEQTNYVFWKNVKLPALLKPLDTKWDSMTLDNFEEIHDQLTEFDTNFCYFESSLRQKFPTDCVDVLNNSCDFEEFVNSNFY